MFGDGLSANRLHLPRVAHQDHAHAPAHDARVALQRRKQLLDVVRTKLKRLVNHQNAARAPEPLRNFSLGRRLVGVTLPAALHNQLCKHQPRLLKRTRRKRAVRHGGEERAPALNLELIGHGAHHKRLARAAGPCQHLQISSAQRPRNNGIARRLLLDGQFPGHISTPIGNRMRCAAAVQVSATAFVCRCAG